MSGHAKWRRLVETARRTHPILDIKCVGCGEMSVTALKSLNKLFNRRELSCRGRIEPSGFFSVTNAPRKKRDKPTVRLSNDEMALRYLPGYDKVPGSDSNRDCSTVQRMSAESEGSAAPHLGSSNPAISTKRAKRGSNGITGPQRRRLFWALECLERSVPRGTLSFLTLTVPTVTHEECRLVQENWPQIVHMFIKELKRELHRKDLSPVVFGCTEIQQERLARDGMAVPHLHLCFRGRSRSGSAWAIRPIWFRETFGRILQNCTGIKFDDLRAVENVQCVKKTVGGYLAKYLSKGFSKLAKSEHRDLWHPRDWVVLGRHCRTQYIRLTRSGETIGAVLRELLSYPREVWCKWLAPIEIPSSVGPITVGWYGFSDDWKVTIAPERLL